jgi:transposase-like protein
LTEIIDAVPKEIDARQSAQQLVEQARTEGIDLVGPGGLLTGLTKTVLETALDAEMAEHLGYDKHDPAGRNGGNLRNGTRAKTVLPRSARSRSRCPGTGTARPSRSPCASGNAG